MLKHIWYKPGLKAKNARPSVTCASLCTKAAGKVRKEIKPIIIDHDDDEPIIIDSDTKVGIETQTRDTTVVKGSRDMLCPEAIIRSLPKPPELIDKTWPEQSANLDPNVDFEENSPHQEGIISET